MVSMRKPGATPLHLKARKAPPFDFVLEALEPLSPRTRAMFGCVAVYVGDKIVLFLRNKPNSPRDNGVWLATAEPHHESLRREFPKMRSIQLFGKEVTSWQVLPCDAPDFEESALHACELIVSKDPRIGKIPNRKTTKRTQRATRHSRVPDRAK
jgi:hypothetical protein